MSLRGAQRVISDSSADAERATVKGLFRALLRSPEIAFPPTGKPLQAPDIHGVYVIRDPQKAVVHVGRTHRGRAGLRQRLRNHLDNQSSFVEKYLGNRGDLLRTGYTFQCLEVSDHRKRALLEYYVTGCLCPKHLGLGLAKDEEP